MNRDFLFAIFRNRAAVNISILGLGNGVGSLMWTLIRELLFSVFFTYLFGIFFSFGLTGIWWGLVVGRTLANILNYLFANHTLNHLGLEQSDEVL